jgi:hypothetical protein
MRQQCRFPGCIAFANEGRDHCTIHYPENVAARAIEIVNKAFDWSLLARRFAWVSNQEAYRLKIVRVRNHITDHIKRTT